MNKHKRTIYLSILNEGWIRSELSIKLIKWLHECPHDVFYEASFLRPIEHNRNTIVRRFLESGRDYLLQIDSDNVPARNPLELVEYEKDIISAPVWIYQDKLVLNIYKHRGEDLVPVDPKEHSGLIEIDATGTGVLLCSRSALEHLERPFERIYDDKYGIAILGQDLAFSQKAKKVGFKIYSHLDYISKHYKMIDLSVFVDKTLGEK